MNLARFISSSNDYDIVWKDIKGNNYRVFDIENRYLSNIINYIFRGNVGYDKFLDIDKALFLYDEAVRRKLRLTMTRRQFRATVESELRSRREIRRISSIYEVEYALDHLDY